MTNGYYPDPNRNANPPTPRSEDSGFSWAAHVEKLAKLDLASLLPSRSESPPLASGDRPTSNSVIHLIEAQIKRGSPVTFSTFGAVWDALRNKNGVGLDDRKFLLEDILILMSRLPPGSQLATQVEHFMIDFLYKDLPHPPSTYLGALVSPTPTPIPSIPHDPETSTHDSKMPTPHAAKTPTPNVGLKGFAWREADGSSNNPLFPLLGAAHTPYARSVASSHPAPPSNLPSPALVFDTLLRRSSPLDHPTGLSSMFFAFANLIIHSLFSTNRSDLSVNDTSSYLDLSPLYGIDKKEQDSVRNVDGRGRLYEDVWADRRLLGMPPATAGLLVVFNRNHNFIADRIFNINERKAYFDPTTLDKQTLQAQDDEIFNRARLVNCGAFMQVIMRDYVGSILRMIPDLTPWHLRPLDPMRDSSHTITPRGEGNVCSVEFNLLYRWHATTSSKDEKWLDDMFKRLLPGKSYDDISEEDFLKAARIATQAQQGSDPRKWTLGSAQRDKSTGRFRDSDLAAILQSASADPAQAFRARGIPAAFKVIEIMGIKQARSWGVCSLNEFRTFLGLKPYTSFEEWNSNVEISQAAKQLYRDIDNMELYVGMQAEETRPSIPGSGLCSGYTMSRSILADAVALIRGDRFLTIEYTPFNLTSWGFQDVQTTDDNGSLGGMLTKLLFRALPQHYTPSSIYAHFPFILKNTMRNNMKKDPAMIKRYDWDEPRSVAPIIPVRGLDAVREIVRNETTFVPPYKERFAALTTSGYEFHFGGADGAKHRRTRAIYDILFTPEANAKHAQFYYDMARELILDKAYSPVVPGTRTVDIVHDVINCVPLHWIATHVVELPLATKQNPGGKYSESELYGYLALLFTYVYFNSEPVNAWFLEHHSRRAARLLLDDIKARLNEANSVLSAVRNTVGRFTGGLLGHHHDADAHEDVLHRLLQNKHNELDDESSADVMYDVFGIMINSAANWSHAMTHVVNFYLDPARKNDKEAIVALAVRPTSAETESLLIGYVQEALRLDPPVAGVLRDVQSRTLVQDMQIDREGRVFANLAAALAEESYAGADTASINPRRKLAQQDLSFVPGAHTSLNEAFSNKTMAQVLRAVFSKTGIQRASGESGELARFTENFHGTNQTLYLDNKAQTTPWPQSLIVQFEI